MNHNKCPKVYHNELICVDGRCKCKEEECCSENKKCRHVHVRKTCQLPCSENEKFKKLRVKSSCDSQDSAFLCSISYKPDPFHMARKCYKPKGEKYVPCKSFRRERNLCGDNSCDDSSEECNYFILVTPEKSRCGCPDNRCKKHRHHRKSSRHCNCGHCCSSDDESYSSSTDCE